MQHIFGFVLIMAVVFLFAVRLLLVKQLLLMLCLFLFHLKKRFILSKIHQKYKYLIKYGNNSLPDQLGLQRKRRFEVKPDTMAVAVLIVRANGNKHGLASGNPFLANQGDVVFTAETNLARR